MTLSYSEAICTKLDQTSALGKKMYNLEIITVTVAREFVQQMMDDIASNVTLSLNGLCNKCTGKGLSIGSPPTFRHSQDVWLKVILLCKSTCTSTAKQGNNTFGRRARTNGRMDGQTLPCALPPSFTAEKRLQTF